MAKAGDCNGTYDGVELSLERPQCEVMGLLGGKILAL